MNFKRLTENLVTALQTELTIISRSLTPKPLKPTSKSHRTQTKFWFKATEENNPRKKRKKRKRSSFPILSVPSSKNWNFLVYLLITLQIWELYKIIRLLSSGYSLENSKSRWEIIRSLWIACFKNHRQRQNNFKVRPERANYVSSAGFRGWKVAEIRRDSETLPETVCMKTGERKLNAFEIVL